MNDCFFTTFQMTEPCFQSTESTTDELSSYSSYCCCNVETLAKAFLTIDSMSHKKLQKLCYYAKAWYLALYDTNLIDEPFEAWVHGAVQPRLYQKYRCYGFQPIPLYNASRGELPEEFISFAREIFESYGEFTGPQLEAINHREPPWLNARKGLKPWQHSNNVISEDDMKKYYRSLMPDAQTNT